jgi:serine/threonine-protein kinase
MKAERWQRVEQLYHAAMERPSHARAAFLKNACSDEDLRREVESLIESDPAGKSVLDQPAWERRLAAGDRLGTYEILEQIGAGGMGEVWKARDTRLERMVAIKFCFESFSARFEREARVVAALNHPNICTLHAVGPNYLVMEYIEGEALRGPLPVAKAVAYARQILNGLEAAHRKGIVHRDLKPANVLVTATGLKLLDFGIAKLQPTAIAAESGETRTMSLTDEQAIVGTPHYMAPEQIERKPVDMRTDIFAFGCVLYELLSGQRAFPAESVTGAMAAILAHEPAPISGLRSGIPLELDRIVRECLAKDPEERFQSVREVRIALDWALDARQAPPGKRRAPWAAAGILAIVSAIALVGWWRPTRTAGHPLLRLSVDLGPDALAGVNTTVAISPDGQRLVFPSRGPDGKQYLATRQLDQPQAILLSGTENGRDPFFSPDGQWIGFFAGNKLKKAPLKAGEAVTLTGSLAPWGGSWGEDGTIVATLANASPLWRLSSLGGKPEHLTALTNGEVTHRWPQILPGGKGALFTASSTQVGMTNASLEAVVLKTGATKIVHRGGYYGRYLPSGHLVFVHQGVLYAARFDVDRLEIRGTPTAVVADVAGNANGGGGQFAVSNNGTLVYLAGKEETDSRPIVWIDSKGKTAPLLSTPGIYSQFRFSPDGKQLALVVSSQGNDIFVYDWTQDAMRRLTFDGHSAVPVWHPDGKHLAFQSTTGGFGISWMRSDGAGEPQRLLDSAENAYPKSFSPDGRRLAFHKVYPEPGDDLWTLPLDITDPDHPKPGRPELFLHTSADNQWPVFSPDGRWIAYRSSDSGSHQIYVRSFRGPSGKWQISEDGGTNIIWSRNGRELFYTTPRHEVMVVNYAVNGDSFLAGKPRLWVKQLINWGELNLDLAPDGVHFAGSPAPEGRPRERFGTCDIDAELLR